MKIAIRDIVADASIDIRNGMDATTIEEYMDIIDELPPVVVFDTSQGYLLADGFHRLTAAERLGREEIEADIKKGSRHDALEFAAYANAAAPLKLKPGERRAGIRRLNRLQPDWNAKQIGRLMACSEFTVRTALRASEVRRETFLSEDELPDRAAEEISRLPQEQWTPLAKVAVDSEWTLDEVTLASRNLRDPDMPDEHKHALLAGQAEPITHKEGEHALLPETVRRRIGRELEGDTQIPFERMLVPLVELRRYSAREVVDRMPRERLASVARELPADIDYLNEILSLARQRLEIY